MSFIKELKVLLKHKLLLVASCIILLIPCLYAGLFIWSYWDPYDKIDELPIGVVNQDKGTVMDDKEIHIGKDLSNDLLDNDDLDISVISEKQAEKGLKNNDYYVIVRIPKDFSKKAMSALQDNSQKAQLDFIPNEGFNYTASSIGESAVEKVKEKLGNNITQEYVKALLNAQKDLGTGLDDLADGGKQVQDGINDAYQGSGNLYSGISKLASGTLEFNGGITEFMSGVQASDDGAAKVATGATDLSTGLGKLENAGQKLTDGSQELSKNAKLISEGIHSLNNGTTEFYQKVEAGSKQASAAANQLNTGVSQLSSQAKGLNQIVTDQSQQLNNEINTLESIIKDNSSLSDEEKQALEAEITKLQTNVNKLQTSTTSNDKIDAQATTITAGISSLAGGQNQVLSALGDMKSNINSLDTNTQLFAQKEGDLATGMTKLQQGIGSSKKGAEQLATGSHSLSTGLNQLEKGATTLSQSSSDLSSGANDAKDGSAQLNNGLKKLDDGTSDLTEGINTVDQKVNEKSFTVDNSAGMISDPVKIDKKPFNHVNEYGPAFAPYFISLGLYVGMFLFCSAFPLTSNFGTRRAFSWFTGKLGIILLIGILQAIILDGLMFLMGLDVDSVPKFILFSILSSWCYGSILLFINAALGTIGRFVTMGILILQLTSAAGSFPLEMLPHFFGVINPYLPMTYTILGLKSLISAVDSSSLGSSTLYLLLFFVIGAAVSMAYYIYKFNKDRKKVDLTKEAHGHA